jgi:hypothetical protein
LKDIRVWEVQAIVDFMYKGEISVVQEQISSLIKTAEALQVIYIHSFGAQPCTEYVPHVVGSWIRNNP